MMKTKRKLPLITDRSVVDVQTLTIEMGAHFEQKARSLSLGDTPVRCTVGCSNCCHHPFKVSALEGVAIYRWLSEHGRWTPKLRERITAVSQRTNGLDFAIWLKSVIPCPLLDDDNRCMAYEGRPLHCRVTFATTPPDRCHPHRLDEGRFLPRFEVLQNFLVRGSTIFKRHGIKGFHMPLSTALLLGEQVSKGELGIEETDLAYAVMLRDSQ